MGTYEEEWESDFFAFVGQAKGLMRMLRLGGHIDAVFQHDAILLHQFGMLLCLPVPEDMDWGKSFVPDGLDIVEYVATNAEKALGIFMQAVSTYALGKCSWRR